MGKPPYVFIESILHKALGALWRNDMVKTLKLARKLLGLMNLIKFKFNFSYSFWLFIINLGLAPDTKPNSLAMFTPEATFSHLVNSYGGFPKCLGYKIILENISSY